MNDLFAEWREIEPGHGPMELLTSRAFQVGRRLRDLGDGDVVDAFDRWPGTDIYHCYYSDFLHKNFEDICDLVDDGLVSFVNEPKMITEKKQIDGTDDLPPAFLKKFSLSTIKEINVVCKKLGKLKWRAGPRSTRKARLEFC